MNLLNFCKDLYTIPRSLTGNGVVKSLKYIQDYIPLDIIQVPSGSKVFDWTIPPEWNIREGYILDLTTNEKIIDFKNHNLHVVGYSTPINKEIDYSELIEHVYYLKDQPEAIPYITSYYSLTWGFCMSFDVFNRLNKDSKFKVYIDSDHNEKGNLTYGELYIPGKTNKEIFFSSYICHPQMVNNELSGPAVLTGIANFLQQMDNHYSYRFALIPETIGSITYLNNNIKKLKENVIGGFNLTCLGDERSWGFVPSRYGNNYSDRIAKYILKNKIGNYIEYSWLDRGSDERQYCAPGIDLPISSVTRSKYGEYPEYHTSLDNFDVVTEKGLQESLEFYLDCIEILENNRFYPKINVLCEPQLGKRGLYPSVSTKESGKSVRNMMNFISYCDGKNSILDISELCEIPFKEAFAYFEKMRDNSLLD
jgi:aminopeptidase-like protein